MDIMSRIPVGTEKEPMYPIKEPASLSPWFWRERFEIIVEQMKQVQGITEQLKVDNTWEWVGRMNNIQACAREIVDKEIIYQ